MKKIIILLLLFLPSCSTIASVGGKVLRLAVGAETIQCLPCPVCVQCPQCPQCPECPSCVVNE